MPNAHFIFCKNYRTNSPLPPLSSTGCTGRFNLLLISNVLRESFLFCRFVQGVDSDDCYVIYHWYLIDIFVYFSHHFVIIPPPCWTNAAHTNGVPVLGTVIPNFALCSKFLEDESSWQSLANQLVDIAEYYRFDGWFLNIENDIEVLLLHGKFTYNNNNFI